MIDLESIGKIAVIGLGTMGPGIVLEFARSGYDVVGFDISKSAVRSCQDLVYNTIDILIRHGVVNESEREKIINRISYCDSIATAVKTVSVVVEAVSENTSVKQQVLQEVDNHAEDNCLILSNTSTLNIFKFVPVARQASTVIAHWFAPPHIIPLVEIVKGEETSENTVAVTIGMLEKMDKKPILIERFVPGFIINRILRNLGREAFFLLDNGYVSQEDLDLAVKLSIAPRMMLLGLIQRYDFTGLDLSSRNLLDEDFFDAPLENKPVSLTKNIAKGDLGVKTGKGFYDYSDMEYGEILAKRDEYLLRIMDSLNFCTTGERLV